jgi:hypothetical protein
MDCCEPRFFEASRTREGRAMRWILRAALLVVVPAVIVLSSGCNLLSVPLYLLGPEEKDEASIQDLGADTKKENPVKVLIWTWSDRSTFDLEIPSADRRLAQKLEDQLKARFAKNKQNVSIIPYRMVEQFRNGRDDVDPVAAGKKLKADYVIYLEVNQFSMNVKRSFSTLLMGKANIGISLYDLAKQDDPKKSEPFECTFPPEYKGGMEVNEDPDTGNSRAMFAETFLNYVSRELAWKFVSHPTKERNEVH